jgi:hypothetical protein
MCTTMPGYKLHFHRFSPILLPPSFKTTQISKDEQLSLTLVETRLSLKTSLHQLGFEYKNALSNNGLACVLS